MEGLTSKIPRESLCLATPYRAPETDTEMRVSEIWSETLMIDPVGIDDDFSDLGGDSLFATEIAVAVSQAFGVTMHPGQLLTLRTVNDFTGLLDGRQGLRSAASADVEPDASSADQSGNFPAHVALACDGGPDAPVFFVHGKFGLAFPRRGLLQAFRARRPIYYISAIGMFDSTPTPTTLEATARAYLDSIRSIVPRGGFHLVGMCKGGVIVHDMARQADERGDPAISVTLVDPPFSRMSGTRRIPIWYDRAERILRLTAARYWHSLRRNLGLIKGAHHELGGTARIVKLIARHIAEAEHGLVTTEGLHRDRITAAQMTLEIIYASARHRPLRRPVNLILSEERAEKIGIDNCRQFMPIRKIEIIEGDHRQTFGASIERTSALLVRLIDEEELQADQQDDGPT